MSEETAEATLEQEAENKDVKTLENKLADRKLEDGQKDEAPAEEIGKDINKI